MRLKDKVAIITGAASGIGAATAKLFAKEGAKVAIVDSKATGAETLSEIKAAGGEAIFLQADVTQAALVHQMVEKTVATYGRLDILHNNAGIFVVGDVLSLEEADFHRCINTNLKSVYLASKYAIPHLIKGGGGVIINTASTAGLTGGRGYSIYSASKAGIILLTQCMALDFASANIRVNSVCPGPTDTPMIMPDEPAKHAAQLRRWSEELPIGRAGRPEDIAQAVLYLASDDAAFVTGTALVVDGGRLLVGIGSRSAGEVDPVR
jgi:NAD(P)-dependent dehydrogenase (short-subunit alcohol dehydrogenase family)